MGIGSGRSIVLVHCSDSTKAAHGVGVFAGQHVVVLSVSLRVPIALVLYFVRNEISVNFDRLALPETCP